MVSATLILNFYPINTVKPRYRKHRKEKQMKPKRYPYTGRKKGPIILQIDQTELCERLNAIEFKSDGLTINRI